MARITSLRPLRRRVIVDIDGRRYACIPASWAAELGLTQDAEVDIDELDSRIGAREFQNATEYALELLADAARSTSELARKLRARGYTVYTCKQVLERITEMRLIDDLEYAKRRAESGGMAGKGRKAIEWKLRAKGVAGEHISSALEEWDYDAETESARKEAHALYKRYTERGKPNARQLTYQALARRGFSGEAIARALSKIADDDEQWTEE